MKIFVALCVVISFAWLTGKAMDSKSNYTFNFI